ncbi:hypothetical protein BDP27DRAFT_1333364 [Rhodocollybia butyracea]|uniref:Uncharacterized protein n=1 Tax=Rhodocollybia butyracea TaxID=206335 RepID=A0A9P5PJT5_9AGAR|nr:hypothetical protein BDP27DRAFT_1333364 [Rhodocollybia butyracea]
MSWSNEVTVIIDNALADITTPDASPMILSSGVSMSWVGLFPNTSSYLGALPQFEAGSPWYNGTLVYANLSNPSFDTTNAIQITYIGAAIAFFGFTPGNNTEFQVELSLAESAAIEPPASNVSFPLPATYCQFYTSPDELLSLQSNVTPSNILVTVPIGLAWDYALVKITNSTDLSGQTILVDDANDEIEWTGNWTVKSDTFLDLGTLASILEIPNNLFPPLQVRPHGNGTHTSTTQGDSFVFQFAGTSISVFGVNTQFPGEGILTMTFTLDDKSTSETFTFQPFPKFLPGFSNFIYFSQDDLTPGNHTLIAEVTQIQGDGISAVIDYLTYAPSWTFLIEKPDFSNLNSTTGGNSSSPMGKVNGTNLTGKEKTGIVTGSVIGGIVILGMICFLFWRRFRFLKRSRTQLRDLHGGLVFEPFPLDIGKTTLRQPPAEPDSGNILTGQILPTDARTHEVPIQSMQDVLDRMARLSADVNRYLQPPAYESEGGGEENNYS